jgi:small-conductance mechanosensitive channel
MDINLISTAFSESLQAIDVALSDVNTYLQLLAIIVIYVVSFFVAHKIKHNIGLTHNQPANNAHPLRKLAFRVGVIIYPFLAIILLQISTKAGESLAYAPWLIQTAMAMAILLFFNSLIRVFVDHNLVASFFRWIGLPILLLHLLEVLPFVITTLEGISLEVGNINVSAYGVARVLIFGSFLFWLGRTSNTFGKSVIRKQASLDVSTKEVLSKVFEVGLFCIVVLLLLNVMGVNLTTLAVFGGAVGVGLGLGLQSIASNFISGVIILLDRSLTVGDFIELDNGQKGFVREFRMRYAVLETYDGKDILVPNEKFISSLIINWSHKDPKQRYRVDFSVSYATDVRSMVELIKATVSEHEQVISGLDIPIEERPDCEIDSFGDSGINMFVEFWIHGIDDGKNRVGGDLMLIILETLKENNIEIPFPQREIRIHESDKFSQQTTKS